MKKQLCVAVLAAIAAIGAGVSAQAQSADWKFEVAPYVWVVGIDGDVTTKRGLEADFDYSFSDITDHLDAGAEVLAVIQYKQFVGFLQADYVRLSEDEFNQPAVQQQLDEVIVDSTFLTIAAGYQFPTIKNSWIDVMVGGRFMFLSMEVDPVAGDDEEESHTVSDAVLVVRPNFPIWGNLRFNPTLSIGAGDSDLVYELQPQFEYKFTKLIGVRAGYRLLHYDFTTEGETELNVNFSGPMLGATFNF